MYKAAVITVSDKGSAGLREDLSGPVVKETAQNAGYEVVYCSIIPDDIETIQSELIKLSNDNEIALILTTGGTGFAKRDVTPEATTAVCEKLVPGIGEAMRFESLKITNRAILSRGIAGIRGQSLIINLPGSPKAAKENLAAIIDGVAHGLDILRGNASDCAKQ